LISLTPHSPARLTTDIKHLGDVRLPGVWFDEAGGRWRLSFFRKFRLKLCDPSAGRLGRTRSGFTCATSCPEGRRHQLRDRPAGIDRITGCVIVVRPDHSIAHFLPLDAHQALSDVFAGVLRAVRYGRGKSTAQFSHN